MDSLSLTAMQWIGWGIGLGFLFAFGACAGSFLNVVVYRLPSDLSVVSPPSRCPRCGARLRWFDNIPILSWLFLRGRCRRCSVGISFQYPLVEIIGGLIVAGLAALLYLVPPSSFWSAIGGEWWFHQTIARSWPAFICWTVTLLGLLGMTLIDARTFTIPLTIPVITTIVCWVLWPLQALALDALCGSGAVADSDLRMACHRGCLRWAGWCIARDRAAQVRRDPVQLPRL